MDRFKGIIYFWAAVIGAELLALGVALAVFSFSPVIQERTYEAMLVPKSPLLRSYGAYQLRKYPSRAAALALIAMLNLQAKDDRGQEAAEYALSSLRELSGQPFMAKWKEGQAFDVPTDSKSWDQTMSRVNSWALTAFGPDALASLSGIGLLQNANLTVTSGPADGGSVGSFSFQVEANPAAPQFDYALPDGGEVSLSFADTVGLAGRLFEAGIDSDTRFARAMMAGDTDELREVFDEAMNNLANGDTAEAVKIFEFLGLPLPESDTAVSDGETAGETNEAAVADEPQDEEPSSEETDRESGATPEDGLTGWELMPGLSGNSATADTPPEPEDQPEEEQ